MHTYVSKPKLLPKLLGMYVQSVKMMFAFFDKLSRNEKATYKARDT